MSTLVSSTVLENDLFVIAYKKSKKLRLPFRLFSKIYKAKVTNQGSDVSKDLCFKHYVNILMIHGSMLLQFVPLLTFCIFLGALTFTSYFCKNDANDGVDIFHIFSIKKLVKKQHTDCVFFLHYVIRWNDL